MVCHSPLDVFALNVVGRTIDFKKKKFVVPALAGRFGVRTLPAKAGTTNKTLS